MLRGVRTAAACSSATVARSAASSSPRAVACARNRSPSAHARTVSASADTSRSSPATRSTSNSSMRASSVRDRLVQARDFRVARSDIVLQACDRSIARRHLGELFRQPIAVRLQVGDLVLGRREFDHLVFGALLRGLGRVLQAAFRGDCAPPRRGRVRLATTRVGFARSRSWRRVILDEAVVIVQRALEELELVHDPVVLLVKVFDLLRDLGTGRASGTVLRVGGALVVGGAEALDFAPRRGGFGLGLRAGRRLVLEAVVLLEQDTGALLPPSGSCGGPPVRDRRGAGEPPGGSLRPRAARRPDRSRAPAAARVRHGRAGPPARRATTALHPCEGNASGVSLAGQLPSDPCMPIVTSATFTAKLIRNLAESETVESRISVRPAATHRCARSTPVKPVRRARPRRR